MQRRGTLFGIAGRLEAAIGVSAFIARFFVIMMPAARQPDSTPFFAAAAPSFTTALAQRHQSEDSPTPALAAFWPLPASGDTARAAEREPPKKQSDKVLRQFMP
jgi:hypothetical protein